MNEFIEKNRVYIGIVLVLVILSGCGVLLWQKQINNIFSPSSEDQELANLQREVEGLRNKIAELETQTNSTEPGQVKSAQSPSAEATGDKSVSAKININTADTTTLEILPGIGPARAKQIIDYREKNGGFKSISEIQNIKGIGPKTFEKMRNMITIGE